MRFDWTPEIIERVTQLWTTGNVSASDICREIGCPSRSALLGKVHRLGLTKGPQPPSAYKLEAARRAEHRDRLHRDRQTRFRANVEELAREPMAPFAPRPIAAPCESRPCSLIELTEASCRWPSGDVGEADFHFCGAITEAHPYCTAHRAMAYYSPKSPHRKHFVSWGRP